MPWRDEPEEWEVCSRCGLLQAECICPPALPEPPSEPQTWDDVAGTCGPEYKLMVDTSNDSWWQ